ncbi:MAG: hypothetical protein NTU87_01590 [Verrucomicrobia bacterium]|nr:hypothetical protein [Verrucomicrobiota bacterium]
MNGTEELLKFFFGLLGYDKSGGGKGPKQSVGADGIENSLVESFAAESLRREEVRIEALEDFWIVGLILLKERILFNRCDELAGLGINLGLVGGLNLEESDPSLKIKEFTLLGRGNAAALEGDFEESLFD